jgi:uncharacterized protein YbjT (DUF2867 family)
VIAITGATGGIGGRVARQLAAAGVDQRLVVRDPSRAPELETDASVEVAVAAYDDPGALQAAFEGCDGLLFVSAAEDADRVALHRNVVHAAADAGVGHVAYTSFQGASADCTFTFGRDHFHTEQAILDAGLPHTFLQDNLYQDVLPYFPGPDGAIKAPAGEGRVAAVAREDVAEVAALALLDPATHAGEAYVMTGPEALTLHEVAAVLSRSAPIPITYEPETIEEAYASRAHFGAPQFEVDGWVSSYTSIAAGDLAQTSGDVERVTGHLPLSLETFLRQEPPTWPQLTAEP